eukprot:scaffold65_cov353-Prasinococcus_capsulatus_cf.AAC.23
MQAMRCSRRLIGITSKKYFSTIPSSSRSSEKALECAPAVLDSLEASAVGQSGHSAYRSRGHGVGEQAQLIVSEHIVVNLQQRLLDLWEGLLEAGQLDRDVVRPASRPGQIGAKCSKHRPTQAQSL